MDIARARSPPASLNRRPIGPRSPGKPGTLPVKNIIPLDLTARLQDEFGVLSRTTSPESSTSPTSRPASPALKLQTSVTRPQSQPAVGSPVNGLGGLRRSESERAGNLMGHSQMFTEVGFGETIPLTELEEISLPTPETAKLAYTISESEGESLDSPGHSIGTFTPPPAVETVVAPGVPPEPPLFVIAEQPGATAALSDTLASAVSVAPDLLPPPPFPNQEIALANSHVQTIPPPPPIALPLSHSGPATPHHDASNSQPIEANAINEAAGVTTSDATNGVNGIDGANGIYEHARTMSEKSVQASIAPPDRPSTPMSTRASTPALLKTLPKRPPLAPLPTISFDSESIKWKALTLEAAQWTFTSEQLQEIVSRAIRASAAESFIRILPIETVDVELPQELDRLESLRATTQAQYRFNMHRRAMLLQSLVALSQSQQDGDGEPLYNLATQLAELTASCDGLLETMMRIGDQKAQIQHVQDLHVASALSMALRKLNTSYAKRSTELQETRARNEELQAELEEAWNMAQDMAQEMDDLDNFDLAFSDEEDWTPDRDPEDQDYPERVHRHYDYDDNEPSNSALEAEIYSDMDRMSGVASVRSAEVVEITGKAVATKATLTSAPGTHKTGDRASRVSAAKKRSSRTSKASLRVPKTPTYGDSERNGRSSVYSARSLLRRRSHSKSVRRAERGEGSKEVPEVPIIRLPEPRSKEASFLELAQTRPGSPSVQGAAAHSADAPPPLPPKGEVDTVVPINVATFRSEEMPSSQYGSNPPPSPTFGTIPIIQLPEEQGLQQQPQQQQRQKGPMTSWTGRKLFARRVQSMQPALRPADDDTAALDSSQLKRSISESKHFDGWPFLGTSKVQRFSVPVLASMQQNRTRKSSDSAPPGNSQ